MSVFPLGPEDREKAAQVVCAAEDCGHHEGDGPHCAGCMAYATHALAALEGAGWTLLPPGTAETQTRWTGGPHDTRAETRVMGAWTPMNDTGDDDT